MSTLALVTGASRGIGAAAAKALARRGHHVWLTYANDLEAAHSVVSAIIAEGGQATAWPLDLSLESEVLALFEALDAQPLPLGILINNGAITAGFSRVESVTQAQLQQVFAVNVIGTFLCAREAVKRMSTARGGAGGCIVNVSSRAAAIGGSGEWVHYAATKGALDTLTQGLAKEVAQEGIRVNGVAPGVIDTDLHANAGDPGRALRMAKGVPMARVGLAGEVAACIAWLTSTEATYITGTTIAVAGGR